MLIHFAARPHPNETALLGFAGGPKGRRLENGSNEGRGSKWGGVAQLGEHLPCKQGVSGSIPLISTNGPIAQLVRAHD